jgi:hypothetical protein
LRMRSSQARWHVDGRPVAVTPSKRRFRW